MHAFDVLGDPVRRRTLALLTQGEHTSGEVVAVISQEFGVTQSAVSQQLRILRESGFPESSSAALPALHLTRELAPASPGSPPLSSQ